MIKGDYKRDSNPECGPRFLLYCLTARTSIAFQFITFLQARKMESSLLVRVVNRQYCEPLEAYKKGLGCRSSCRHEEVCHNVLVFRSRWAELNNSLATFFPADFQVNKNKFARKPSKGFLGSYKWKVEK